DARDAPEPPLERRDELALDLARRRPRERDDDVDHRDDDLRLLLPRGEGHREDAEQDRGEDDDGRQLRAEERARDPPGEPVARLGGHGITSTGWPSRSAPGSSMTTSPSRSPARTGTRSPIPSP